MRSPKEESEIEAGKRERRRGRGRRGMSHQEEPRGALAQEGQGEGMVQIQRELNRKKKKTVGPFLGHYMAMSHSRPTTSTTLSNLPSSEGSTLALRFMSRTNVV